MRHCVEILLLSAVSLAAFAQPAERRATITGGGRGDDGKCIVEVAVDGSADIEIRGDRGLLRTVTGQPSTWRRFQCTSVMPAFPDEFGFRRVDGRGNQELVQEPRSGRGAAVIRIQDPRGGADNYAFEIEWRGNRGQFDPGPPPGDGPGRGVGFGGGWASADAISACLSAVELRGRREGYRDLRFGVMRADERPGRADWIVGTVRARRGPGRPEDLEFSCAGDLETGNIRSVQLNRR